MALGAGKGGFICVDGGAELNEQIGVDSTVLELEFLQT